MDLNRFQLLLDVVRCGSLSRAAIARGVPQSWVSRHISALEGDCGGRLLDRTGRGVELSQFGRDMMPMIEEVLTKANALSSQLAEYGSSPRGEVTVGLLPSFVPTTASHLFAEVSRRLPNVKLTLVEGSSVEIEHWLEDGSLDIGLVTRKDAGLGVEVIKKRVPLYLVGPKGDPYTMNPTVPFAKLSRLPLILPRTPSAMRPLIDGVAKRNGVELHIVMESDSFSVQLALAASGAAYAILGAYAVRHAITHEGALSASKIVSPTIERAIALAMSSKRRPNEAIRGVARLLRSVLTETIEAQ